VFGVKSLLIPDLSAAVLPRAIEDPLPRRSMLLLVAAGLIAVAVLMHHAGLSIDPFARSTFAFLSAFTMLAATRFICRAPQTRKGRIAGDIAEYYGLFTGISLLGAIASYPIAAASHGFVDAALQRSDLMLHFDWLAWYRVVAAHPMLQIVSRAAYSSIYVSPAILLGHFAVTDQRREAHDFLAVIAVAATITLAMFRFMPAVGPFGYLWHGPIPYLPVSDLWQPELIPQLRAHAAPVVDLGHLVGLVSAPSFHAAAAVLMIAFALRQPLLRVPLTLLNGAMLLSTPVEGTHYLTDMILGACVAAIALAVVAIIHAVYDRQREGLDVSRAEGQSVF
jgi:hypothetical protein